MDRELVYLDSIRGHTVEVWDDRLLTSAECTCGWFCCQSSQTGCVDKAKAHITDTVLSEQYPLTKDSPCYSPRSDRLPSQEPLP